MAYSSADYLSLFQALLPQGPVWPREPDSVQTQALATLMPTWGRLAGRDANILVDAFPQAPVELLPDWEASLGLPDPCADPNQTIQQRQAQVYARFAGNGGQNIAYYVSFAANLGYPITIDQFAPARADVLVADGGVYDPFWAFVWRVNTPALYEVDFRADVSFADEPLAAYGGTVLECELQRVAPAHTIVLFAYTGAGD